MCHETAEEFIKDVVRGYHLEDAKSVLEVGCATGPDFKALFNPDVRYVGVDRKVGPRVSMIADFETAHLYNLYEVAICAEVLEHTLRPWRLISNLQRHMEPKGVAIITARGYDTEGYAPVHDAPFDFWRMAPEALLTMMEDAGFKEVHVMEDPSPEWPGVLGVGRNG